jgi:hypothetical protein
MYIYFVIPNGPKIIAEESGITYFGVCPLKI